MEVRPLALSGKPIRKCPKCGVRTSLLRCPGENCKGAQTVVEDLGIGRK